MPHLTKPRMEAAAALRALNNAFVAHDADDAVLDAITAFATATLGELERGDRRDRAGLVAAHVGRMFGLDTDNDDGAGANGGAGNHTSGDTAMDVMADRAVAGTA